MVGAAAFCVFELAGRRVTDRFISNDKGVIASRMQRMLAMLYGTNKLVIECGTLSAIACANSSEGVYLTCWMEKGLGKTPSPVTYGSQHMHRWAEIVVSAFLNTSAIRRDLERLKQRQSLVRPTCASPSPLSAMDE